MKVADRRSELFGLLGDLPERDRPISATLVDRGEQDGYVRENLVLDLNGLDPVPAYFVRPAEGEGPWPCVLYNHSHGGNYVLGRNELLQGCGALQSPPYARALTELGFAALCIDHWCFGDRGGRSEEDVFKEMLWNGQVLWGMMVYDSLRAVDYLAARPDIDANRIGTLGISMGSTMAWWLAALDPRIAVCIDLCCLTDFRALIESGNIGRHGIYYFVPSLLKHFTTAEINALIAPRPHLSLVGERDVLTPAASLDGLDQELRNAYQAAGNPSGWRMIREDVGHVETPTMRQAILDALTQWLA